MSKQFSCVFEFLTVLWSRLKIPNHPQGRIFLSTKSRPLHFTNTCEALSPKRIFFYWNQGNFFYLEPYLGLQKFAILVGGAASLQFGCRILIQLFLNTLSLEGKKNIFCMGFNWQSFHIMYCLGTGFDTSKICFK